MPDILLSILICTRNRPADLDRCLSSIPDRDDIQIVVSDDGEGAQAAHAGKFPRVEWVVGPRRGLGANRNKVFSRARGRYVLFLDDDAALGGNFLAETLPRAQAQADCIVTGIESNKGLILFPSKPSFLGHQNIKYRDGEELRTVVINAAIFPRSLLDKIRFDEEIIYGYDEVDISAAAVAAGGRIVLCPNALNYHDSSPKGRDAYQAQLEVARIAVTFKRYRWFEGNMAKAYVFLVVSALHLYLYVLRRKGLKGVGDATRTLREAWRRIRAFDPSDTSLNPRARASST